MSAGLKEELGLEDPKPSEPSAQKDEFKQKFKAVIDPLNENLQYTSAHAQQAKHDTHAVKKEASYKAYQAAMGKINPTDPSVAKDDIEKVMTAIENAGKVIAEFKQASEKSFNAWTGRQGEVDQIADKIREMQDWGHPKAVALNGVADFIRGKANERSYDEATASLDQMLGKMGPIVDDYEKQKAAQKEFEPTFQALQPRLEGARACGFAALAQQKQDLSKGADQVNAAVTAKDYVSALPQLKTLETTVGAFEARKAEIEAKKKEYEAALPGVKSAEADGKTVYQKLSQDKQNYETLKGEMESSATAEDYEAALSKCNDLTARVDAYITAVEELEKKEQEYETAEQAVGPKLETAGGKTVYQKLSQDKQNYETLKGEMESSATAEDYEAALSKCNDLTARVDAYITAVEELEKKKHEYETAEQAVGPKLETAGGKTVYQKLSQDKQNYETLKGEMESSATTEDYEAALSKCNDLTARVDAYITAVEELEKKKQEYETAEQAVGPKLETAGGKTVYQKLSQDKQNYETLKGEMESSATTEDYEAALSKCNDLTARVDAYITAVEELEKKKQEYETAEQAVGPKLETAGGKTVYQKLSQDKQNYETLKGEMESSATTEDYEAALSKCNDLTARVDAYITAVEELEKKKQEYETAEQAVRPKLETAGGKTVYQKLSQDKQNYETLKGEMESSATTEDYEAALSKCNDLTARVDAYITAVEELEKKKQEYETAKTTVQQKFDSIAQSNHPKLAPKKLEIETLKGQMESAAQTEDFETALAKATEIIAKVDEYATAAKELEEKEKQYNDGYEALKSKLEEASKSQHPDAANLESLRSQMERSAQNGEYDQALKSQEELKAKVEAILAAPKEAGGGGAAAPDGKRSGGEPEGPRVLEKLDRDSDSPGKGASAPTAPAGNQLGIPSERHSPAEGNVAVTPYEKKFPEDEKDKKEKDPKEIEEKTETEAEFTIYKNKKILGMGTTKVGISLGPTGELGKVSVEVAAIKEKFKLFEAEGGTFDLDIKLSGKSEIKLKEGDIEKFKLKVKAEVQASFSKIPVKPGVNATADNKGEIVAAFTLEFPIPGGEAPPTADRPKSSGKLNVIFENKDKTRTILLTVADEFPCDKDGHYKGGIEYKERRLRLEPKGRTGAIALDADSYGKASVLWWVQKTGDRSEDYSRRTAADGRVEKDGQVVTVGLADPVTWSDVEALCHRFLSDHHFKAVKNKEGDKVCDMHLDGKEIEKRAMTPQGELILYGRLVTAIDDAGNFPIELSKLFKERWEYEVSKCLTRSEFETPKPPSAEPGDYPQPRGSSVPT